MNSTSIFTLEQTEAMSSILNRKYARQLNDRSFAIEGFKSGQIIEMKVTLASADRSFVYPVEGRLTLEDQNLSPAKAKDLLLDFLDSYFEEYLQSSEEIYLPIDWTSYECDGVEVQLRGQVYNEKLDKLADDLIEGKKIDLQLLSRRSQVLN